MAYITKAYVNDLIKKILAGDTRTVTDSVRIFGTLSESLKTYFTEKLKEHPENDACVYILLHISILALTLEQKLTTISNSKYEHNLFVQVLIGDEYRKSENHQMALLYFNKAHKIGNIGATCFLVSAYTYGHGCEIDFDKAIQLAEQCIENNYYIAYTYLGYIYSSNKNNKYYNAEKAINCFILAYLNVNTIDEPTCLTALCTLESISTGSQKRAYKASLDNRKMLYHMQKSIDKLEERMDNLEKELYAPGNMGAKMAELNFTKLSTKDDL